jgi:hypothetical protein
MPFGRTGYFAWQKQTALAASADMATAKFFPFDNISINQVIERIMDDSATGSRDRRDAVQGAKFVQGDIEAPSIPNNLGWFFFGNMGGTVTSAAQGGTTAYKHQFTFADTIPFFTVEANKVNARSRYFGCVFDTLKLSCAVKGMLKVTVGMFGQQEYSIEPTVLTKSLPAGSTFTFTQVAVTEGAAGGALSAFSDLKAIDILFDNGVDRDSYCLDGTGCVSAIDPGGRNISGSMEMEFRSRTQYDYFRALTFRDWRFNWTGLTASGAYNYGLDVYLNNVLFRDFPINVPGNGKFTVKVNYDCFLRTNTYIASVWLTNLDTGYS